MISQSGAVAMGYWRRQDLPFTYALAELGDQELVESDVEHTLGWVLKYREDIAKVREAGLGAIVRAASDA